MKLPWMPSVALCALAFLPGFAQELPPFPKSHPERFMARLKLVENHRAWRQPREDWEGARQRVQGSRPWQLWLAVRRAEVDDWMARRCDHVEWVAGWGHDFVSPKDGSMLTFKPDEPVDWLSSPSDPRVPVTPKLHAAWVYAFRGRHCANILEAARLYRLTGERRYADWAMSQLDFYADNWSRWPKGKNPGVSRLMWQALDEASLVISYVHTARLLGEVASPERRQRWWRGLFSPEAEMLNSSFQRIHNIACWQRSAVAHIALLYQDESLWKGAIDGPFGVRQQLARGITGDYLWYEQSLHYSTYVVQSLLPLFHYAAQCGRGEELSEEMAVLENMMLAPLAMRFPNGQLPNPADAWAPGRAPNLPLLASAYRLFPTGPGCNEAAHKLGWEELLDPPKAPPKAAARLPEVVPWNLESSRMAIIRQGPWQVYFHYGQLAHSHWQAEALNYEASYLTTQITHDPGTTGYGSPLTNEYFRLGSAHNVPLVDGQGQEAWAPGRLESFSAGQVRASQPHYRKQARATRQLQIIGERLVDEVSLETFDGVDHALGFLINLDGRVVLPGSFRSENVPQRGLLSKYWWQPRVADGRDRARLRLDFGGQPMDLDLALPGSFRVWHAWVPDVPPRRREALYVEVRGRSARLRTVLQPVASLGLGRTYREPDKTGVVGTFTASPETGKKWPCSTLQQ